MIAVSATNKALKRVLLRGGNLSVLSRLAIAPHVETLCVRSGFIHPFMYDEFHDNFPDKEIVFPKLRTLLLDGPDTHYLFYHSHHRFFPNINNLYLHYTKYDGDALLGFKHANPQLTNIYYTNSSYTSDQRYARHAERYSTPPLHEITQIDFEKTRDNLLGNDFLQIDDEATSRSAL